MPHIRPHIGNSAPRAAIYVDTHLVLTHLLSILSLSLSLSLSHTHTHTHTLDIYIIIPNKKTPDVCLFIWYQMHVWAYTPCLSGARLAERLE